MLEGVVTSKTMRDLLVLLYLNPSKEYYLREIARRIGQQPSLVKNNIKRLGDAGMVKSRKKGNNIYYSVDESHKTHEEIKSIVAKAYDHNRDWYGTLKDEGN